MRKQCMAGLVHGGLTRFALAQTLCVFATYCDAQKFRIYFLLLYFTRIPTCGIHCGFVKQVFQCRTRKHRRIHRQHVQCNVIFKRLIARVQTQYLFTLCAVGQRNLYLAIEAGL